MTDMPMDVESFVIAVNSRLDRSIRVLTERRHWTFVVGAVAIVISLVAYTPVKSMFDLRTNWAWEVYRMQVAHPLTPIDLQQFEAIAAHTSDFSAEPDQLGRLAHLEKLAFRISIPIIGKLLHTGAASWVVLNFIAGFLFFPMLASVANTLLDDRVSAAYLTIAFALSWAGTHFFHDSGFGDGFAWFCLLAAVYFRHPLLIFAAVLVAGFTDERALAGSGAVLLYWFADATAHDRKSVGYDGSARLAAVIAAWLAYLILRWYLSSAFGLKTGLTGVGVIEAARFFLSFSIPYQLLDVFQGLWIWIIVAMIALYVTGRRIFLVGFAGTLGSILAIAIVVWDFSRSVGYSVALLPVAWQVQSLKATNTRTLARICFVLGLCLVVPGNTVFRQLVHLAALLGSG